MVVVVVANLQIKTGEMEVVVEELRKKVRRELGVKVIEVVMDMELDRIMGRGEEGDMELLEGMEQVRRAVLEGLDL